MRTDERSARIDLRTSQAAKALLTRAAEATHKSVTEFLLENGLSAAERVIADQVIFQLNDEGWDAFCNALGEPPQEKPTLAKLLKSPGVFDS